MKVADFIIHYLADYGIKDIFVVYGAANGDLVDAFTRTDKTRYVAVMHEQGGGFAMEGYAKISGKPGVGMCTSGPGGMNFVTPIGNCFYDSVPALFITGQINVTFMRPDPSVRQVGFQEAEIVEIVNVDPKGIALTNTPFVWNAQDNSFYFKKDSKVFKKISGRYGTDVEVLNNELRIRSKLLYEMQRRKIFDFDQSQKLINQYYKNPKAVLEAFGINSN